MKHLSAAVKEAIVQKVLSSTLTVSEVSSQHNIGESTLSRRMKIISEGGSLSGSAPLMPDMVPRQEERFKHLQATSGQDNVAVGAYCRQHGLYPHQLTEWEKEFMTKPTNAKDLSNRIELKNLKAELKKLKREIVRNDKVIVETAALLVLKKKDGLILEGNADD